MKVEAVVLKPTRALMGNKESSLPGLTLVEQLKPEMVPCGAEARNHLED